MRELNCMEIEAVSGAGDPAVEPLIENAETAVGKTLNELHEAYLTFLNMYAFPLIYY